MMHAMSGRTGTWKKRLVGVAIGVVVLFCVASFAGDRLMMNATFARYTPTTPTLLLTYDDIAADYPREDVSFEMDAGTLRGHIYGPDNTRGLIIFRHGIFSQHQDYLALITALVDKGWKVFAYDAIGCGESDGDSTLGFPQSALDVRVAIEFAQQSSVAGDLPVLLFGHSWGGYGVAAALEEGTPVKGVVSMSGFYDPMAILDNAAAQVLGPLGVTQHPFLWLNNFIDFGANANLSAVDGVNAANVPVLIVYGTNDETVPCDTVGIASQFDSMQNAPVSTLPESEPGRDGHNDYFYSPASQAYLNEKTAELEKLTLQYPDGIPSGVLAEFMAGVDKKRANTADPSLIEAIDEFFSSAIAE